MSAETSQIAKAPAPRFGQFTLRTLLIAVAIVCVVLGWRQLQRQFAFNVLWNLASNADARDNRNDSNIGDAMYRLVPLKNLDPLSCLISRINERKCQLAIVQLHRPLDPLEQTYVRLTVLNRFGQVTSIDTVEIGSGIVGLDDANFEMKHDGLAIIKLQIRVDAEPIPEPLILVVDGGKIRRDGRAESPTAELAH